MSEYPKVDIPENCCDGKKNEYLEKIKELLDDGCFDCCTNQYPVSRDSVKEVWAIAERMAKEIKTKDGALTFALLEVDRLKAEIEKREEVVRCEDCIWNDGACDQEINYSADDVDLLSYCSAGQRR